MTGLVGTLETAAKNLAYNHPTRQVVRTAYTVWLETADGARYQIAVMQHDHRGLLAPEEGDCTMELTAEMLFRIWQDDIQQIYNEREGGKLQKTGRSCGTVDGAPGSPGAD